MDIHELNLDINKKWHVADPFMALWYSYNKFTWADIGYSVCKANGQVA